MRVNPSQEKPNQIKTALSIDKIIKPQVNSYLLDLDIGFSFGSYIVSYRAILGPGAKTN